MKSVSEPSETSRCDLLAFDALAHYYDEGADTNDRRAGLLAKYPEIADQLIAYFVNQDRLRGLSESFRAAQGAINDDPTEPIGADIAGVRSTSASLDEYELIEEICTGGMGIVYRARRRGLDRTVALKVLRPDRTTASDRMRFQNEIQAVAYLDHPNIVPIYDVGPDFFAMKLIPGGSLAESLPRYMSAPRTAAQMMVKIARAVHHAHERGILHRDLKPSNVLLDGAGEPYVGDFGLAKRLGINLDLTQSGQVLGTLNYMAPEQAIGRAKDVTTRTDIWGLGTILYGMLTGRPPFAAISATVLLVQLQQTEPDRPSSHNRRLGRDLEAICLKCLEKDPENRYASALAVAEDLERWLTGRTTVARPIGRMRRAGRWCRRNPVMAALVAGVGVLGLAIGVSVIVGVRSSEAQRRRAESRGFWVLQGITEPFKKLANPELARDPAVAEARRVAVTEAIEAYRQFVETLDDSAESRAEKSNVWIHIGLLYTVIDDRQRVCEAYQRAVDLSEQLVRESPANAGLWDNAGMANYHLGMELWYEDKRTQTAAYFARAVSDFDEALKRDSDGLYLLQHAAWFLTICPDPQFRQPSRALELAKKLVDLATPRGHDRPRFSGGVRPLFTLGLAQYRVGDFTGAQKSLEESCQRRSGGDAYELFVLALVHARLGNESLARSYCDQAVNWTRKNRYGDFELHFFDEEASLLPALNGPRLHVSGTGGAAADSGRGSSTLPDKITSGHP
jgi:tetratricopeptide (TPR) repeat protein/predicted Ser/Thr protein kinase